MSIKITIKDNSNDVIIKTTSDIYEADLKANKEKLNIWWNCQVEYDDGTKLYDAPCNHNGLSPRRIIKVNGRYIYAKYNFDVEGKRNVYDELLGYLDIDFKTNKNNVKPVNPTNFY